METVEFKNPISFIPFWAIAALYQSFPNLFLVESGFFVSAQIVQSAIELKKQGAVNI